MEKYKKEDFDLCILDTYSLPMNTDLLKVYPWLKYLDGWDYQFEGFFDPVSVKNCTIRYINYFYSKELQVLKMRYPDYRLRKIECARLAGFGYDQKGRFNANVEKILNCQNHHTNRMILSFLRHNYSDKYSAIVVARERYYKNLLYELNEEITDLSDTKKAIELINSIEKMELDLLCGDKTPNLNVALVEKIEVEALGLKPEDIATKIRKGEPPINIDLYD